MRSMFAANHIFYTIELINKYEPLYTFFLCFQSVFLSVSQLEYRNCNSYPRLLLLLSGGISLNPGPFYNIQPLDHDKWNIFKHRGLHFLHLNISSLLPKMDKLDDSLLISEIQINEYDLLRWGRNRHGGGVACYIRNDLSLNAKSYFPEDIESIFFELLLPNTKPIIVGTIAYQAKQILMKTCLK